MSSYFIPQEASCLCGTNTFEILSQPLARFICHCRVCQDYTKKPYSDVTVTIAKNIAIQDINSTVFRRHKLPPNIRRGSCTTCKNPVIEFGAAGQLVLIPTSNYSHPERLPEPKMHIFYHRRITDINDNLPKYSGFIKSQTLVSGLIMQGVISGIIGHDD